MIHLSVEWDDHPHVFVLHDGEHLVGRDRDCDIQIPVVHVSRRHAAVRVEDDHVYVRDLGSANGTSVDGVPVGDAARLVSPGGWIDFAGVVAHRTDDVSPAPTGEENTRRRSRYRAHLAPDGMIRSRHFERLTSEFSPSAQSRIAALMARLFHLITCQAKGYDLEVAVEEFVRSWTTADRVALLKMEPGYRPMRYRQASPGASPEDPLRLSSTILWDVVERHRSVLIEDVDREPRYRDLPSVRGVFRSAMAVPVVGDDRVLGLLYVDTANLGVTYTQEEIGILEATAEALAVLMRLEEVERELRTASRIQRTLLPSTLSVPRGYELYAKQTMCLTVGGDLYHSLRRPDGTLLLVEGDVCGKGLPAALAMAEAMVILQVLAETDTPLKDLVEALHRHLSRDFLQEQFVTAFVGSLDPSSHRLTYVNAAHPSVMLVRRDGHLERLRSTSLPVAILDDTTFEEDSVLLEPGDLAVIYTDGIPEATVDCERFFEEQRLVEVVEDCYREDLDVIAQRVFEAVDEFLGGQHASDDATLLLLRRR